MDGRRHFKILICGCLFLVPAGFATLRSQEPRGPVMRPVQPMIPIPPPPGEGPAFGREQEAYRRLEQVPADERETFKHNLEEWRNLPPEQRVALRNLAHARARAEIDKAIQDTGLHLDADQREVFGVRYTQERRKLERDLQRQAAAERARRMPEILAKLKSEFGGGNSQGGKPAGGSPAAAEAKPESPISPAAGSASPAVH
jgi:hypothetical protein